MMAGQIIQSDHPIYILPGILFFDCAVEKEVFRIEYTIDSMDSAWWNLWNLGDYGVDIPRITIYLGVGI